MLIDKKEFWEKVKEISEEEVSEYSKTNLSIAKSEKAIEKLLKADKLDVDELLYEIGYLSRERCSVSYVQGLQDGTKILHTLLSGEAVNHMQRVEGIKADNQAEIDWRKTSGTL